jgi:hypothetical protein
VVSICLVVAVSLPAIEALAARVRLGPAFLGAALIGPFFLSAIAVLPQRIPEDWSRFQSRKQAEAGFGQAATFVRSQPGDAMCESLLVCNAAGKPLTWDTFVIGQLVKTGKVDESRILGVLALRGFAVIEIDLKYNESLNAREHVSPEFTSRLLANYQLGLRTADFALFVPRRN